MEGGEERTHRALCNGDGGPSRKLTVREEILGHASVAQLPLGDRPDLALHTSRQEEASPRWLPFRWPVSYNPRPPFNSSHDFCRVK